MSKEICQPYRLLPSGFESLRGELETPYGTHWNNLRTNGDRIASGHLV